MSTGELHLARPGLGERLLMLLFPARCLCCGSVVPPQEFFCRDCAPLVETPPTRQFRLEKADRFLKARAPLYYRGGYRETLHRYKFRGERGLAGQLGRLMAGQAHAFAVDFDAVTYTPLSPKGLTERGYDQSRLLAKNVARGLGLPLLPLLEKIRETDCQHTLGRTARFTNIRAAYRADTQAAGKTLLLIDDIVTTGATLCQCAEALYTAGAKEVYALCAASAQKKEKNDAPSI